jgi:hypothetical protein
VLRVEGELVEAPGPALRIEDAVPRPLPGRVAPP